MYVTLQWKRNVLSRLNRICDNQIYLKCFITSKKLMVLAEGYHLKVFLKIICIEKS